MDVSRLYRLRVRTARLELRVPTHDELVELRELARAGVHPPELMPFAHAWTDEPYSEQWVVAHFERRLAESRPDAWNLPLGVWAHGSLAGLQDAVAQDFAATKAVETGSWLGMTFQRRGYGTEMRAAMLELAFRGLGAEIARSGYIDGNIASQRVSDKLGYRRVGRSEVAPRGVPVGETQLELRREDWRCPFPVKISGLEAALPLLGVAFSSRLNREG
ncbi:MAG: GNAT family N-acetyltransferase [Gaiellaceae bacterium]